MTDTLPCPSVEIISRALGESGSEVHLLMDLLEAADALGNRQRRVVMHLTAIEQHPPALLFSTPALLFIASALQAAGG